MLTWPSAIYLVRHGESAGNVARDLAEAAGEPVIDIATRDMDVPLSTLGQNQAIALGKWIGALDADEQPTAVYCSPYVRACETATLALDAAGIRTGSADPDASFVVDERLREREFGILDRLTRIGIQQRFPDQAAFRAHLGKFYHRPPGGESWADVILRLRSVIDTLTRDCCGQRVLIVTHQVVVLMFRYLLENLTEAEVLAIDRQQELANCSVTSYEWDASAGKQGALVLRRFNHVGPLEEAGAPVTTEPDVPVAPK